MRLLLGLLVAVSLGGLLAGCTGGDSLSTEELQDLLSTIPVQPNDVSAVVSDATWEAASEGEVSGSYAQLANDLPATAASQADVQPIAAYERVLEEQSGASFRDGVYPPRAYSVVLLFDSSSDAEAFYNTGAELVRGTDWLSSHPARAGAELTAIEAAEQPLVQAEVLDQVIWQHVSGLGGPDVFTDDIVLLRDGRLVAFLRAPGFFAETTSRTLSGSAFESGLLIPMAQRVHDPGATD